MPDVAFCQCQIIVNRGEISKVFRVLDIKTILVVQNGIVQSIHYNFRNYWRCIEKLRDAMN